MLQIFLDLKMNTTTTLSTDNKPDLPPKVVSPALLDTDDPNPAAQAAAAAAYAAPPGPQLDRFNRPVVNWEQRARGTRSTLQSRLGPERFGSYFPPQYVSGQLDDPEIYHDQSIIPSGKGIRQTRAKKYNEGDPITDQERALADEYQRGMNYPSYWYLGTGGTRAGADLKPLSRAQKKARRDQIKLQRANALDSVFGGMDSPQYARAKQAYEKYLGYKAANAPKPQHWDFANRTWVNDDEGYIQERRAYQNVKKRFPATITRPEYVNTLAAAGMRGSIPSDEFYEHTGMNSDLAGQTLRTLGGEKRKQYLAALADLLATLNVQPVYDPRLLTPESAAYVFNPDDYDIQMVDADRNALTPGVCVISTKVPMKNSKGEQIPAGTIVAVNGYRLQDGTEASSMKRMKDMLYYRTFSAPSQRKANPQSTWMGETFGAAARRTATGLKVIADWVKTKLRSINASEPRPGVPSFLQLSAGPRVVYFKLTGAIWNTICSRIGELVFNHWIASNVGSKIQTPIGLAQEAMVHLPRGEEAVRPEINLQRSATGFFNMRNQYTNSGRTWGAAENPIVPLRADAGVSEGALWSALMQNWTNGFFVGPVLNAMMRDPVVKKLIETRLGELNPVAGAIIGACLDIVMRYMMNPSTENWVQEDQKATLAFLTPAAVNAIVSAREEWKNIVNLSSVSKEDLRVKYRISMRGNSLLYEQEKDTWGWLSAANYPGA